MTTEPLPPPPHWTGPAYQTAPVPPPRRRLTRSRGNRWIGGVCAGLGRRYGMSPNLVRLLFVLSCLLPGPQFIIYLMLWVIIPNE